MDYQKTNEKCFLNHTNKCLDHIENYYIKFVITKLSLIPLGNINCQQIPSDIEYL